MDVEMFLFDLGIIFVETVSHGTNLKETCQIFKGKTTAIFRTSSDSVPLWTQIKRFLCMHLF